MHPIATEWDNPAARLVELGHAESVELLERDPAAKRQAVKSYQWMHDLQNQPHPKYRHRNWSKLDGILGEFTELHMRTAPRKCLHPDIAPRRRSLCKWPFNRISHVNQLGAFGGLSAKATTWAFRAGLELWSGASGLAWDFLDPAADKCDAHGYVHPGRMSMGTLGWQMMDCSPDEDTCLEMQLNDRIDHTHDTLLELGGHEGGHFLGIDHYPGGIMVASGPLGQWTQLSPKDVASIQSRYGQPTATDPPTEPPELGDEVYEIGRFSEAGLAELLADWRGWTDNSGEYFTTLHAKR